MIPTKYHARLLVLSVKGALAIGITIIVTFTANVLLNMKGDATFPKDCAVVFGAAVHNVGDPGPGITRRVKTATDLYHEGKVRKIFLTGGKGDDFKESEAHVMRKVALLEGVDPSDIVLEEQATSTIENILYTKPLTLECESIVGISDRYHLARINMLAGMYDWSIETFPASPTPTRLFELKAVLREVAAFLYTKFLSFRASIA